MMSRYHLIRIRDMTRSVLELYRTSGTRPKSAPVCIPYEGEHGKVGLLDYSWSLASAMIRTACGAAKQMPAYSQRQMIEILSRLTANQITSRCCDRIFSTGLGQVWCAFYGARL